VQTQIQSPERLEIVHRTKSKDKLAVSSYIYALIRWWTQQLGCASASIHAIYQFEYEKTQFSYCNGRNGRRGFEVTGSGSASCGEGLARIVHGD
jgi:hypothetical protein